MAKNEEIPDLGSDAQKLLRDSESKNAQEILSQVDYELDGQIAELKAKTFMSLYKHLIKEGATRADAMHITMINIMPEEYGKFKKSFEVFGKK